ncbi:MAG: flagellar basal body L-ring protein FlgH [Parahaliea sp.]
MLIRSLRSLCNYSLVLALAAVAGCAGVPEGSHELYGPVEPIDYGNQPEQADPGGLFRDVGHLSLFSDTRAHRVGDIVSVILVESTDASKSADTSLGKDSTLSMPNPTLFGEAVSINDRYNLGIDMNSASSFEGKGASAQSNSLRGSIAVQVAQVLPNGNLYVQGEKWIRINKGDEYIRLRGIIRPEDLSPSNTISSTRIADARISYSGRGAVNESNTPGWLTRFFMSPLMPF